MKSTFTFFKTVFALIVLFFLHPVNNSAQVLTGRNISIVGNSGGFFEYLPVNYSTPGNTQTYPLIIFGQGLGELGDGTTQLPNLLNVGLPHVIASGAFPATFTVNGQTFSFIVIAPQYFNAPSIPDIQNVINYAVANYRVDVNRIYMTGLSNGGGKCWEYASNQIGYANRLAAIVPICGSYYANDAGSRIIASSNLPVWATHNDGDPIWPVASTIGWIDLINRAPYPVPLARKTIFPNNNSHDAWTQTYDPNFRENGLNIYEWMLQYKRNYVGTNQPPIANAGGNVNLALPNNSTLLYATNSWDPDGSIVSYNWSYRSGPSQYSINSTTSSTPFISNLALGRYVFGLTVTDNGGATTSDSVIINVYPEIKPIPGRIEAETYNAMSGVQKENTTDSGGAQNVGFIDNGDWMDYTVNVAAAGPYTVNFRVAAQNTGAQFQLRQSNGTVLATMNVPQTGDWQIWTTISTTVTLPAGVQTLRVLANSVPSWTFNWFEFIAVDRSPTANAGPFQTIIVPASQVTLTGSATPNNGGTIASYAWSQVSGTAATITNPSSASTTVTGLTTLGARVFRLTATDNEGRTGTDDVTITVNNPGPPTASAGAAQIIQLPTAQVILTGSGTANNGGTITYAWTQVSGTAATIATPSSAITTITGLSTAGVRVFRLTVTDNGGSTATSDVTVTVNPVSLSTPYGGNRRIIPGKLEAEEFDNGGQNIAYYDGTTANTGGAFRQTEYVDIRNCPDVGAGYAVGWTTDGEWLKFSVTVTTTGIYSFTVRAGTPNTGKSVQLQVDGATAGTLTVTNSGGYDNWATSTLNNVLLIAGDHTFRFLFNTGDAVNTSQGFDINWFNFALVTDMSPVANAGNAQSIFLPTSQVTLTGSGTANNGGSIVSYTWTQVSGTADASITSPSSASTSVTGLSQGVYVFRLTVTDNQGATASNNVTITVNPIPGFVTITASNPQTIAVSTASLTSASSGTVGATTTKWTKFSVPGQTIKKLTVIGSSTAAGNGATAIDSAFVNRLKTFYTAQGIITTVTNLAVAGQSPWDLTANNAVLLTAALNTNPDVLLMAYPSDAYPLQTIPVTMAKFQQIADSCTARGVKLYISGTQPRNDYSVSDRQKLVTINDSLRLRFTTRFIDFLKPLNNTTDNTIKPEYNSGDGIQLNNAGHTVIAEVTKAANIFQNTISSASTIVSPGTANTSITGLVTGVHQFQVSVVDSLGFAATAIATITTNIPIPPPTANAGIAQTIALPITTITLAGSGTPNNGGTIASYAWTQVSGTAATITNPSSATTTVTGLTTLGVRVFRLTVTDNQGGTGTSDVIITVNPLSDGKTIPGKIEAEVWDTKSGYQYATATTDVGGGQQMVGISNGSWMDYNVNVAFTGTYTVSFRAATTQAHAQFQILSGNNVLGTINIPSTGGWDVWSTFSVANISLTAGSQTIRILSTNTESCNFNWMNYVSTNQPPTANAGPAQTITLPVSQVTLTGTGSSPNAGGTVTYAWSQISGPNTTPAVAIVSPASATTNVTGLIQGVYVFRLTVTDNLGGTITSDVTITVNQPPTANAGPAQTIVLPASVVTLTGTGTAGNAGTITYAWTKISGPNTPVIVSPATATTNINGLIQGVYVFRLTVTNNIGATATNDVTITVNQLPTANAGLPQTIFLPLSQVTLTGTGTAGSGGTLTYAWTKISGPNTPVIVSAATASTTITGLVQGVYVFRLTVTENGIATPATGDVTITVNTPGPPTANAGINQTITLPISQVTLTGTGTAGNGGTIAYGWAQISGPNTATIVSPAAASTSVNGFVVGTYVFQLTVTQNDNQTTTSNITITVNPSPPPTANAGSNQTITLPASQVTLTGSGTSGSGGTLTYGWSQISGPNTATIVSPVTASTSVTGLVLGTYVFQLTVTQNDNQTITSNVSITVNPSPPPTANSGSNQTITLPASQVTLTGSGTSGSGGALTYGWSQISGPNTASIVSPATASTSVSGLILGTYVFKLTVTQSDNQTATSNVTINVNSNPPPTANAGSAQTITLPITQATLTGSGTAGSGTLIYLWSQTSGPNTASIVSPATASTSVSGLIQGAYLFKLTVTQTDNQVATSTVTITVNTAPVANAGANQTIQLPVTTVSLTGSGTDADGSIASYAWTQVSGTAATITSASSTTTTITGLTTAGARVFRLTVTDNRGATGTADVTITVSPANIVPVANAGINQTIQLPVATVSLTGSATDADGTIASYTWTQISGTAATITSPSSAATTITGLATAGIRMFRLTATDNQGATGTSDITITVNAASGSGGQSNLINVNLYDNNDPYSNIQWNNQLITQTYPYTSGAYKYIDGSASTIFSTISANQAVADNGAGYATTMCPSAVGRYASYYPSTRTITLKGLDNTKVYTIQLYCSRATSQGTTRNTINGVNVDIPVTNNFTTIATFPNIVPAANQIVVTQSVLNNYVYLNGFTITEKSSAGNQAPVANAGLYQTITLPTATVSLTGSGTDADGTIASYAWTQVSGTAATITNASSASTTITGLSTAGVRVFRLTVTDNQGATGTSDVTVTVNTPGNQAPVANAGANQTITLPTATVSLTGSGTDADGTIASYAWTQISGTAATITTPSLSAITITGLSTAGVRVFRLTVTDNQGATGTSDVTVTVNTPGNQAPVANAGANQTITLPTATVSLTGSGTDADGTIASYAWTQVSGTVATITTPSLSATTITGLSTVGVRVFRLTVTDNLGATGTSDVTITVNTTNISPVANAGANQTITLPTATVSLTGSGTDTDGTIASYAWTQVSGTTATITTPSLSATTITGLSTIGARVFRLTVTDNLGATGTSDVTITVNTTNISPVANAGANQTITLPTATVSLTGSGTDTDGTIASYAWTQVSGTTATITTPSLSATTITGLSTIGARVFRLTVTDNLGASGTSDVIITVNPVAGTFSVITNNPQSIPISTASLTSTATGNIVSTNWTKFSVPGQVIKKITVIGSSTAAGNGASVIDSAFVYRLKAYYISQGIVTTITNLAVAGQSQWDLTDNNATLLTTALNTNPDVMLMAFPSNAYPYQTFPAIMAKFQELYDSATNRGILMYVSGTQPRNDYSVSDRQKLVTINDSLRLRFPTRFIDFLTPLNNTADNTIKPQYNSGDGIHPNNAGHAALCEIVKAANIFQNTISSASVIVSPGNANTSVTGLVNGVHQFQVSVIDNGGFAASAIATVTVNIVNQPPVANAGTNQTIQLPVSTVSLSGSGTDVDGTIASYSWSQVSGTAATITTSSSVTTTITGLTTTGTRVFRLTVTDNQGATATSDVTITVTPANIAPVANAGTNQTITLPVSTVSLSGSGTDTDGTIASYAWTQVSGTVATITSPSTLATTITGLATAGVRIFRLTVTDNQGATGTSDVTVTVNPGSNTPPTANAGINQTIQLPVSTVTLTGSGTDADGAIASYAWTQVSGTVATITSPSSASTTITGLTTSGAAIFRLTVTDNQGATGTSDVTITVNPAVVSNGKTIPGRIEAEAWDAKSSYQYQVATTDVGGGFKMVGISTGSSLDYNVTVLSTGLYTVSFRIATPQSGTQFQIKLGSTVLGTITMPSTGGWDIWNTYTVTNVALTAGNQTLRILSTGAVNGDFNWMEFATAGNQSPTAVAGANQTITLPVSTVSLTGSGTDVDGTIASYAWTQVSGTTATITSPSLPATTITGLTTAGTRVFRLMVTDNQGATGTSDVTITVNPTPPPTAIAGSNQTIILPVSQITLAGNGTAGNGGVITYAWTQLSGTAATITNASSPSTTVTGLTTAGVRVFRLTVTQSDNQIATSDVTITVNNPGPPTATAGSNQTITLPTSQVSLTGSGTAGNGGTITYGWTKISGPNTPTIASATSASTLITGLVQGTYVFRLTVTQSDNQTATSDVTITVNPVVVSNGKTIPGRIEAEAWDAKSSYQYQVATTDVGGGFKMVGISTGSSMDYNVTVLTSGIYTVSFRVATSQSGSQFLIKLGNTILGTANLPSTGGWDLWSTYTISNVVLTAGSQTLRILSNGSGNCDFNWMEYTYASTAQGDGTTLFATASAKASLQTATDDTPLITVKPAATDQSIDIPAGSVQLFPNPVSDHFLVRINNDYAGAMKIQVIDQAGRIMKEMQVAKNKGTNQTLISAKGLSRGIYFIRVQSGNKSNTIQMIKL